MIYICLSIKTTAMKKIFAALILIVSFACAYGQDYAEITMSRTDTRTRGIIEVPEASISHELLVVSFPSSGLYSPYDMKDKATGKITGPHTKLMGDYLHCNWGNASDSWVVAGVFNDTHSTYNTLYRMITYEVPGR